jgi:tripartite-type tricarboxylate transporter receptor subunit TctC
VNSNSIVDSKERKEIMMKYLKLQLFKSFGMMLSLSLVFAFSAASVFAAADGYPSKLVRLIVPSTAGSGNDIVARQIAPELSKRLGKPVVVENRAGSGGIGAEAVAKSAPDGYTLLITSATHTTSAALQAVPYDPIKSFTPIARVTSGSFSLVVHPSVPAKSVKELIALAKQRPGKLIFGTSGMGGIAHLGTELFMIMANIDLKRVHFKGGGPMMIDLLGGHSDAAFSSTVLALPHVKSDKVRVLGTGGVKRSVILPNVPTIEEAGLPGFELAQWYGILAPASTPAPIVDRLSKELKEVLALGEIRKKLSNDGAEADYLGPTEFGPFLEKEMTTWARIVKTANIKVE